MKFRCSPPPLRAIFAAITAILFLVVASANPANAQRLPDTVRPDHYTLTLTPDLKAASFAGVETIDVTLAEPADHITLNSAEIAFQSVSVTSNGKRQTATVSLDNDK